MIACFHFILFFLEIALIFSLFMCSGSEPHAEEVVKLVCRTGGVAVLAHPWALKNPLAIVKDLKDSGLHAIEAYRSDGKLSGITALSLNYTGTTGLR